MNSIAEPHICDPSLNTLDLLHRDIEFDFRAGKEADGQSSCLPVALSGSTWQGIGIGYLKGVGFCSFGQWSSSARKIIHTSVNTQCIQAPPDSTNNEFFAPVCLMIRVFF